MAGSIRSKIVRPWVVMPLVAVVALGGWLVLQSRSDEAGSGETAATATDQVVEATTGTMARTVSAEGTVAAADTDDLSFSTSGTVTAVNVKAGDKVTAGQVLATIDSAELEADVSDAEATLADAEATRADDEDADASDEQLEADAAAVTTAQDRLDAAHEALDGAQLVATFDGTVASVDLTVGEELGSGGTGGTTATGSATGSGQTSGNLGSGTTGPNADSDGSSGSTAQIQVISAGSFTVELSMDDTDISQVKVGQLASVKLATSSSTNGFGFPGGFPAGLAGRLAGSGITADAADAAQAGESTTTTTPAVTSSGDSVAGLVTEVGTVADASSGVASYPVTVAFQDSSGDFNVGATVSVEITYAEVADAVQVPTRAVTTTDGVSTVTVRADGTDETRTVTTGLSADGMVQITRGLEAGESVVIALPTFPGTANRTGGANGGAPTGGNVGPLPGFEGAGPDVAVGGGN